MEGGEVGVLCLRDSGDLHSISLRQHTDSMSCRVGTGALVRQGLFWYPVRLLQLEKTAPERQWRVRFWRLCSFAEGIPDPDVLIHEKDIVDELWNDRSSRRKIRVRRLQSPGHRPLQAL